MNFTPLHRHRWLMEEESTVKSTKRSRCSPRTLSTDGDAMSANTICHTRLFVFSFILPQIGFAKFRSHQEAQQAIAVLSGRRVDAEKGSLLKAEMAKKNLHTRRGLSNELVATPGPGLTSTSSWAVSAPIGSTSIHPVNIAKKTPHPLQHRNS